MIAEINYWLWRWHIRFLGWGFEWAKTWHFNYGHPEDQPWEGFPESVHGPRSELVCTVGDWLTRGWLHD